MNKFILGILLLFLMYWRLQVSTHRFFDVDEFSYLHWAANLAHGQRPYTDFFMFFTPGFLWFFAPLIMLFPYDGAIFPVARIVSLGIFIGMLVLLGILFADTRKRRWALLPVVLLAFLPMPYDKFIEVRPDNLATFLAFFGLILQVKALIATNNSKRVWFWSGFFYMASLIVFAKTLPFVFVGVSIALLYALFLKRDIRAFFIGLSVPLGVFLLWVLVQGDIGAAWYSLVLLPFEANKIGNLGVMEPHLFFFPNGSFYGGSATVTRGLLFNHAIWFIGILMGVFRFFTPFIGGKGERRVVLSEVLISSVFILSVIGYVKFFPLKHSQYLIPIALFIAYYCADAIVLVLEKVHKYTGIVGVTGILLVSAIALGKATIEVNQIKLSWSNTVQLAQTKTLLTSIPKTDGVLDLEGRMLFWKDAYYICCVPFGSFVPYMSVQPPVLREVLEKKKTPYIFQGDSNRLYILSSDDLNYIKANYTPVSGWNEALWERNH